jgi:hypothetical protein
MLSRRQSDGDLPPDRDGIAVILVAHGHQDVRTIVERMFGDDG